MTLQEALRRAGLALAPTDAARLGHPVDEPLPPVIVHVNPTVAPAQRARRS